MGKYEILCRLATGGMAEIFLAFQRGLAGFRKIVVLKSILPDVRGEEEQVRMFLAEAQITAQLCHPHIAQVFDLDIDGDVLFLAMEFVQGCTLIELARACDKAGEDVPIGLTLRAVHDTALALHYAHTFTDARGRKTPVVHRDVAEKNIMVTHQGTTKLLDFGIAKSGARKLTTVGMVKGSTGYMSPEQIRGETVDPRSDVFSLGVVAHECLTGYRLFRGKTPEESMLKTLETVAAPPSAANPEVSAALDAVVLKALERERDDRFGTALELARELEKAAGATMWPAEQCGALVLKHFGWRQEQVRALVDTLQENSGESGIDQVLAAIQAAKPVAPAAAAGPVPVVQPPAAPTTPDAAPARVEEKTDTSPAYVPAPAPERITDLHAMLVPANPPEASAVSTAVVASLLEKAGAAPLPSPTVDLLQAPTNPAVTALDDPAQIVTAPATESPNAPTRRTLKRKSSRGPLVVLLLVLSLLDAGAAMKALQLGPFQGHGKPAIRP